MSLTPLSSTAFQNLLNKAGFFTEPNTVKIAVAVSGGADSLALLLLLKEWLNGTTAELIALHVNHGLRPESSQEAHNLHLTLQNLGIKHQILKWEGDKPATALQEKARSKRYELLENWCHHHDYPFLFLGHHQGDQAETYCMRLRRHSGLLGLACMRPLTRTQQVTLVRPFLNTSKESLKETCRFFGVDWIEDPSNQNLAFERVFWRKTLQKTVFNLEKFQNLRHAYEKWVQRYLHTYAVLSPLGYVQLQKQAFISLPRSFQEILLSYLIRAYGTSTYPLTTKSLSHLLNTLQMPNFSAVTAGGLKISSHQKDILFIREYRAITEKKTTTQGCFIWDKRFVIQTQGMPEGCIGPVGEKGWGTLLRNTPDLKALSIPRGVLWSLPALWRNGNIHLNINMIYEFFTQDSLLEPQQKFIFRSKLPF